MIAFGGFLKLIGWENTDESNIVEEQIENIADEVNTNEKEPEITTAVTTAATTTTTVTTKNGVEINGVYYDKAYILTDDDDSWTINLIYYFNTDECIVRSYLKANTKRNSTVTNVGTYTGDLSSEIVADFERYSDTLTFENGYMYDEKGRKYEPISVEEAIKTRTKKKNKK